MTFSARYVNNKIKGKATYQLPDENGEILIRRHVWWGEVMPETIKTYVYNTVVMEVAITEGKVTKMNRWLNYKITKQKDESGEQEKLQKQKVFKIEKASWHFAKIQVGKQTPEGILAGPARGPFRGPD